MLAVFERIDMALVQELMGNASGADNELTTVLFENQVVGGTSVPDARISARFVWWFETKTERGAYDKEGHGRQQLREHSRLLADVSEAVLFVLTPDAIRPDWFDHADGLAEGTGPRIHWLNFAQLADAILTVTSDPARMIGEQTRFLLTELVSFFDVEGLLSNDDVVVVAAGSAWPEYPQTSAYVCQPERRFRRGITHLAFYTKGQIQDRVAVIEAWAPVVTFSRQEAANRAAAGEQRMATLINQLLDDGSRLEGEAYGVMFLSGYDDPATVRLEAPIDNDSKAESGRTIAWVQGQRYTSLARLTSGVARTSQL